MVVLIPAYQPDQELVKLANRFVSETDFPVVVVNDGSDAEKDAVFAQLPQEVTVLRHDVNKGKGRAMKTGMEYIAANYPEDEGVVIVDADGQHLLPDVLRVCEEQRAHPEALILGSRQFTGKVPLRSRVGNAITRCVFKLASATKVFDTQTGLRAFSIKLIPMFLALKGERYEYEMHMLLDTAQKQIPIREVYIETVYLDEENSSSHFNPIRDSLRIYGSIIRFVAPSIMKFACSSFAAFVIDYVLVLVLKFLFVSKLHLDEGLGLTCSAIAARAVSSMFNFIINRILVFKSHSNILLALIKYYAVVAVVMALNLPLLHVFNITLDIPLSVAKLIVETLLFAVSFILQRFFVFKRKGKTVE